MDVFVLFETLSRIRLELPRHRMISRDPRVSEGPEKS